MRNILRIFTGDVRHLLTNVIGAIVVVGFILVPSLYAWFATAGFWDPYSNTKNIQVAVANLDEGYQSDLVPVKINAGDNVVSALHENDNFDWVFVDEQQAIEGIESGQYYASIIIPKTFSADLMTVFSDDITHSSIIYYTNEKENAIAPRVTDAGASAIQVQIDETFTETVTSVALSTASNLMDFLNGSGLTNYATVLSSHLDDAIEQLDMAASQTSAFAELMGASCALIDGSADLLGNTSTLTQSTNTILSEAQSGLNSANEALGNSTALINQALSQSTASYDAIKAAIDRAFDAMQNDPAAAKNTLLQVKQNIANSVMTYTTIRDQLSQLDPQSPAIPALTQAITILESLTHDIDNIIDNIDSTTASVQEARKQITDQLESAKSSLAGIQSDYEATLAEAAGELNTSLSAIKSSSSELSNELDSMNESITAASGSLSQSLHHAQDTLTNTTQILEEASAHLHEGKEQLDHALASGDLETVKSIIGSDPGRIASFLAAPTKVDRHAVYPVANNGSAMSPYYTSLSMWVASLFMVVLMSVHVSQKRREKLDNPTPNQLYLGRYGVFGLLALLQATTVALGNVFFLGVQCEHLLLYLLTCWVSAFVFSLTIYTLVVSFGNVGKAISVIGLVLQLAGSGGIFPVEMSGAFFEAIYPWLPFAHSMPAMQACIAGLYGNQFWIDIIQLLLFAIPALLLGLVLRKPMIRFNQFFIAKVEETKLI